MKFKNDKERIAFLEDFRNEENGWYLWHCNSDIGRRWWRLDLPGCAFIVEEQERTHTWPRIKTDWDIVHWFIIDDWEVPFADGTASRSMALAQLKEIEKSQARKEA